MSSAYLWVKALHIVLVTSWFAGLFYLPRIFVNLAMVGTTDSDDDSSMTTARASLAERGRLLLMAGKLYRFMGPLMVLTLVSGLVLWLGYGVGIGSIWMPAKLVVVIGLICYHVYCGQLLKSFQQGTNKRSHVWFRWFNEVPVLGLLVAVILVVVKPF